MAEQTGSVAGVEGAMVLTAEYKKKELEKMFTNKQINCVCIFQSKYPRLLCDVRCRLGPRHGTSHHQPQHAAVRHPLHVLLLFFFRFINGGRTLNQSRSKLSLSVIKMFSR